MATFPIEIPDDKVQRVINAAAIVKRYRKFQSDGVTPNPESKAQFFRRMVAEEIKNWVAIADGIAADEAARAAVADDKTLVT
jgi:ABC-type antimicrobial peptide transport system ATPase subunit